MEQSTMPLFTASVYCLGLFIMLKWLQLQDGTNPLLVCFWTRNPPIIFHVPRCCPAEVNVKLVTLSSFHPAKLCLSKKFRPVATDHFPFIQRRLATLLSDVRLPFPWCLFHNSYTTSYLLNSIQYFHCCCWRKVIPPSYNVPSYTFLQRHNSTITHENLSDTCMCMGRVCYQL